MCRPAVPSAGRRRVGMSSHFSDRRGSKTRPCGLAGGSSPATGRLPLGLTSPKFSLEMGGFSLEAVSFVFFMLLKHTPVPCP